MKKLLFWLMGSALLSGCSEYDDSELRNGLNDVNGRVTRLQEELSALQTIVTALQSQVTITQVEENTNGYTIHFSDGKSATIRNGMNSGDAPEIGVKQDKDGFYYWTVNGSWLTDDAGKKVKAQGTDGTNGEDSTSGKDGITPQLKIENGYWYISYNNGSTWTQLGKAVGEDGKDGNSIFKSVTEDKDNAYFTLTSGTVLTVPKSEGAKFAIVFNTTDAAILNGGESKTISYTITGSTENTVVKAIAQDGWKAIVNPTSTAEGTITVTAPNPIVESEILVFVNDGEYRTLMATLNCMQGQVVLADNAIDTPSEGGTVAIKLMTNMDYTVEISADAQSWLSLAPATRALQEKTLSFQVAANEGTQRFATVFLKDEQKNTLQTIMIQQLGTCTEVHVETKGELENVLSGYDYARIKSLKITGILNDADFLFIYYSMPALTDLDISEVNITELPAKAFYSKNVQKLILPKTLTIISEGLLAYTALTTVEIPASVETIQASAFKGCSKLATVTFEPGSQLKLIGGALDATYSNIYHGAFSDCSSLTSIEIPASVETIQICAFKDCSKLATVTFEPGSRLKTIAGGYGASGYDGQFYYGAFSDCSSLTSIEIPASVEMIESAAFQGCSNLATVTFEPGSQLNTIGGGQYFSYYYGAFAGLYLTTVDMSNCTQVTSIEDYAFWGNSSVQLFKIGTSIPPRIGTGALTDIGKKSFFCILKVPSSSVTAYKAADGWSQFANITGLDE